MSIYAAYVSDDVAFVATDGKTIDSEGHGGTERKVFACGRVYCASVGLLRSTNHGTETPTNEFSLYDILEKSQANAAAFLEVVRNFERNLETSLKSLVDSNRSESNFLEAVKAGSANTHPLIIGIEAGKIAAYDLEYTIDPELLDVTYRGPFPFFTMIAPSLIGAPDPCSVKDAYESEGYSKAVDQPRFRVLGYIRQAITLSERFGWPISLLSVDACNPDSSHFEDFTEDKMDAFVRETTKMSA